MGLKTFKYQCRKASNIEAQVWGFSSENSKDRQCAKRLTAFRPLRSIKVVARPRTDWKIKKNCNGLARALKRGCRFIFFRAAWMSSSEARKGYSVWVANSIMAIWQSPANSSNLPLLQRSFKRLATFLQSLISPETVKRVAQLYQTF